MHIDDVIKLYGRPIFHKKISHEYDSAEKALCRLDSHDNETIAQMLSIPDEVWVFVKKAIRHASILVVSRFGEKFKYHSGAEAVIYELLMREIGNKIKGEAKKGNDYFSAWIDEIDKIFEETHKRIMAHDRDIAPVDEGHDEITKKINEAGDRFLKTIDCPYSKLI